MISEPAQMGCPRCQARTPVLALTCPHCGFPFSCDITPLEQAQPRWSIAPWRVLLGLAAIIFFLTSAVFYDQGYSEYYGLGTAVVAHLAPDLDVPVPVNGPAEFQTRTQLVFGLLKSRAPDFYYRIRLSVKQLSFLPDTYLETPEGRKVSLEDIGALAYPAEGLVEIKESTAFPSGRAALTDRDVFIYAGALVHELRHIELHQTGRAPGGAEEEVLCEQAAYAALTQAAAPKGVLVRYQMYFADPQAREYQRWYKWYENWD